MKPSVKIVLLLLSTFSLSGCFVGRLFQDTTIKRYKSVDYKKKKKIEINSVLDLERENPLVNISVFSTKISPNKKSDEGKTLWDLDGKGEAKLLEILNDRNDESDESFFGAMGKRYLKKTESIVTDYSTQNLRIVLSVSKFRNYQKIENGYSIADRIEYLKVRIKNDGSGIHFTKWNKFETEYGVVNIGDVTFNESVTLGAGIGGSRTSGNDVSKATDLDSSSRSVSSTVSPSLNISGTSGITELQKLNQRFLGLNGTITEDSLILEQEGIRDIDLAGNVILDVEVKFNRLKKESFFQFKGFDTYSPGSKSKLNIKLFQAVLPEYEQIGDIFVPLEYTYVYRNVSNNRGAKTFYEWDDKVVYVEGKVIKNQNKLLKKSDYIPQIYFVGFDGVVPNENYGLYFRNKLDGTVVNVQSLNETNLKSFVKHLLHESERRKGDETKLKENVSFDNLELVSLEERFWTNVNKEYELVTWQKVLDIRKRLYVEYEFDFDKSNREFF
ncbi:MAG: hypothetical protein AAGA43_05370 [Bacteroidota bacterium]